MIPRVALLFAFGLAAACFLLSFFEVRLNDTPMASATGIDLVMGNIPDPKGLPGLSHDPAGTAARSADDTADHHGGGNAAEQARRFLQQQAQRTPTPASPVTAPRTEPNALAIVALICAFTGMVMFFVRMKAEGIVSAALAAAGVGALLALRSTVAQLLKGLPDTADLGIRLEVAPGPGFWGAVVLFGFALVVGIVHALPARSRARTVPRPATSTPPVQVVPPPVTPVMNTPRDAEAKDRTPESRSAAPPTEAAAMEVSEQSSPTPVEPHAAAANLNRPRAVPDTPAPVPQEERPAAIPAAVEPNPHIPTGEPPVAGEEPLATASPPKEPPAPPPDPTHPPPDSTRTVQPPTSPEPPKPAIMEQHNQPQNPPPQFNANVLTGFATPYINLIDSGALYRKPFKILYTVFAVLNLLGILGVLGFMFKGGVGPIVTGLFMIFALWIGFQIWWNRREKVNAFVNPGSEFVALPVFSHLIQTNGEWAGTFVAIAGVGASLGGLIASSGSSRYGGYGMDPMSMLGEMGAAGILVAPILGFLILIITRAIAEQIRALARVADNTRNIDHNTKRG